MLRIVVSLLVLLSGIANAELRFIERARDGVGNVDGLDAIDAVVVSPDQRHVYTAGFGEHAISAFRRDPATGHLSFVHAVRDEEHAHGLAGVHGLVISPDGLHVYGAGFYEDEISVFARNATDGVLEFQQVVFEGLTGGTQLDGVFSLAISPDGKWLYAAAMNDNAISVYERNPFIGILTYAGSVVDGVDGVDGLGGVFQITISPDGKHLYAVGGSLADNVDNAVTVFARNETTGALELVETIWPPTLDRAHSVEVGPDGRSVYVSSFYTNRVLVFARDDDTGTLTQVQEIIDGVDGVSGLVGPHATAVTPDGTRVHVAGFWSGVLATFARDPDTGMLTLLGQRQNGSCGVRGLSGVRSLALAANGTQLYAAGEFDDSVSLFHEVAAGGCVANGPMCQALQDARPWAVVSSGRARIRPVFGPDLILTRVHGGLCGDIATLAGAEVDGEAVAVARRRGAASFGGTRFVANEVRGGVVTGGGPIRGVLSVSTPVVDTTGTHPALERCAASIQDVSQLGIELGGATPTLSLGAVTLRSGETRTIDARGATVVSMDALVLEAAAGVERDGDCSTSPGARLELETDPGAQLLVNVSGPVQLGRCHTLATAPGALVVLHAVGRGKPVTIDDAAVATPDLVVLAPDRLVTATALGSGSSTALGNVFGRKVDLRGDVEVSATCAD